MGHGGASEFIVQGIDSNVIGSWSAYARCARF
jgi:hypothetical protein